MKIILLLYLLICPMFYMETKAQESCDCQEEPVKKPCRYRYYYLWDWTLSMFGYHNGQYDNREDIWEQTIDSIVSEIKSIPANSNYEVYVIPFQDDVLVDNITHITMSSQNKKSLIQKILSYKTCRTSHENGVRNKFITIGNGYNCSKLGVTRTCLSKPLNYVYDLLDKETFDFINIITDGIDNVDENAYLKSRQQFCNIARDKCAAGKIINLKDSKPIVDCFFEGDKNAFSIAALELQDYQILYNIRDKKRSDGSLKPFEIIFMEKGERCRRDFNVKVRSLKLELPFDNVIQVKDGVLMIQPQYTDFLLNNLNGEYIVPFFLSCDNNDHIFLMEKCFWLKVYYRRENKMIIDIH